MSSAHTIPKDFENAATTGQFGFVFEKLGQENHMIIVTSSFSKNSVSTVNVFSSHENEFSDSSCLNSVFKKLLFCDELV